MRLLWNLLYLIALVNLSLGAPASHQENVPPPPRKKAQPVEGCSSKSPEALLRCPTAPPRAQDLANTSLLEIFGPVYVERFISNEFARTLPEGDHLITYKHRVMGPDYEIVIPLFVTLDQSFTIIKDYRTSPELRSEIEVLPPFQLPRARALTIGIETGLQTREGKCAGFGKFYDGLCLQIRFRPAHKRFVWIISEPTSPPGARWTRKVLEVDAASGAIVSEGYARLLE